MEIPKFDPSRPALFKVIGTDTDRSATCDFQLVIHNNENGPISYRFRENRDFSRKSQIQLM